MGKLHVLLLEDRNVSSARIASREPFIWEIGDKTEVHVTQEEFLPYLKEARDVKSEVQYTGWVTGRKWCKGARQFGNLPACLCPILCLGGLYWHQCNIDFKNHWLEAWICWLYDKRIKSKVLRILKCAIFIFDLSLTLNWEKEREDFEISLSIYQLSFPSYNFFSESSNLYASESTVGEDAVLSKQFICLLPDTHKVCPEEIFQSFNLCF